jgi:hypothetical protein
MDSKRYGYGANSGKGKGYSDYSSVPTGEFDDDEKAMKRTFDNKLKQQNANLDTLESSILRLGDLGMSVSKEVDLQNRMLTSLETDMDIASEKADTLILKTKELVKKSGGPKSFCLIVTLIIILLILTFLVVYT